MTTHARRGAERADVRGNEYATARTAPQPVILHISAEMGKF